jgi:hypothetical protein
LPYLPEEDVKEVVGILEDCIKRLELIIKNQQSLNDFNGLSDIAKAN